MIILVISIILIVLMTLQVYTYFKTFYIVYTLNICSLVFISYNSISLLKKLKHQSVSPGNLNFVSWKLCVCVYVTSACIFILIISPFKKLWFTSYSLSLGIFFFCTLCVSPPKIWNSCITHLFFFSCLAFKNKII